MKATLRLLSGTKYTLGALALLGILAALLWRIPQSNGQAGASSGPVAAVARTPIVAPPTPTAVTPSDPLLAPAASGKWSPIFTDSFNGSALDTSHWSTCFWWSENAPNGCQGSAANGELEWYLPENVHVSSGALDLVARRDHITTESGSYSYTSGVISTTGKFAFQYGYVEARIRVTKGVGVWPAVWMLPQDHAPIAEIDIAEILGDRPQVLNTALHFIAGGVHQSVGGVYWGANLSTGYHVVAVDWEPQSITWYEDGKVVYRVTDVAKIPHKPMYLLLDSAVGGYWSGNPTQSTPFPNNFYVDWVQVWSHTPAPALTPTATPGA